MKNAKRTSEKDIERMTKAELIEALRAELAERKRAEESSRASQSKLAGITGSAMDAIITIDADQRITLFNTAAERMFRCPAAEALGQSLERFIPERFRRWRQDHIRAFGETNVTKRSMGSLGAIFGLRADGEEFPIEASISQAVVNGEKLFTVILRDITRRVHAEAALRESREQLASILDTTIDGIITVDDDQRIVLFNASAEKIFRCSTNRTRPSLSVN